MVRLACLHLLIFTIFSFVFFKVASVEIPKHIIPETTVGVQETAVTELIERAIGKEAAKRFSLKVDKTLDFRSFQLSKNDDNTIKIIGSDGVSVAKGFHHYFKYYLNIDFTWLRSYYELPATLDLPNVTLSSTSASSFIYHQNVCTWSYSFAWWDWTSWRRHIDWMAMMGITLTIAPIQEQIWHEIYTDLGLTDDEINEHFAGPAFQAWQRMGNMRGWAGPLPATYRQKQLLLQKQILKAQRELGMSVALPAFAGHLPVAMERIYPNINFTSVDNWNAFPSPYCCMLFLDPNEVLFKEIAGKFLRRINEVYGSNHIYFADPFNEINPRLAEVGYINTTAYHIYESMRLVDPTAIWLLQAWMFTKPTFWTNELTKAFLTAVPRGKLLVLDLHSEIFPQYERTSSYYGQPFIWCMLLNFGGTLGMHGAADTVNTRVQEARKMVNSTMIGVGITPEGIHQNYVMYALALERGWSHEDFDLNEWFSHYADTKYGIKLKKLQTVWHLLHNSVYSYYVPLSQHGKYTITRRPSLNIKPWTWYNISDVQQAWSLLLDAHCSIPEDNYATYANDLVDVTRQFLQAIADQLYINLISAYKKRQLERFIFIANEVNAVFENLEEILATDVNFLLGPWIESAKAMGETPAERQLFEINARNQITAWGPTGQILDYATKQWSGIVRDYYQPRWKLFLGMLEKSMREKTRFNNNAFKDIVSKEIENAFSTQVNQYPLEATGDSFEISLKIYNSWKQKLLDTKFLHFCRLSVNNINSNENC